MRGWVVCPVCHGIQLSCGRCAGQGVLLGDGPTWDERINTAELLKRFNEADYLSASYWEYSPCHGREETPVLRTLFTLFWRAVLKRDAQRARELKKQIDELE